MSTPSAAELEVCEVCGKPAPVVSTLAFRRGKVRRVCVFCLAESIQAATGFKVVSMVRRMLEARAEAPLMRAAALAVRESLRQEYAKDEQ